MSLRDLLRHAIELRVARADERNSQLSVKEGATDDATNTQPPPDNPHEYWRSSATGGATPAQLAGFEPRNSVEQPEKLRVALTSTRNTQLSGLTAHRLPTALVCAINRCCDARGDDDRNRAALIAESSELSLHDQADMREHIETEAGKLAGLHQPQRKECS